MENSSGRWQEDSELLTSCFPISNIYYLVGENLVEQLDYQIPIAPVQIVIDNQLSLKVYRYRGIKPHNNDLLLRLRHLSYSLNYFSCSKKRFFPG